MKIIKLVFANLCLVIALMFIVLYIVNSCNPGMGFLSNKISTTILLVFCLISATTGICYAYELSKKASK